MIILLLTRGIAVVFHVLNVFAALTPTPDLDDRDIPVFCEFKGIGQKVCKYLPYQSDIAVCRRKLFDCHINVTLSNQGLRLSESTRRVRFPESTVSTAMLVAIHALAHFILYVQIVSVIAIMAIIRIMGIIQP